MSIVLIIILMLAFTAGIGGLLFFLVRKLDPSQNEASEADKTAIAQDFLPFEDIRNDMIILPNHNYRAVLECSSLNYDLKTEGEREQIELSFQQFINSLSFPIMIFLQTKEIDNSGRIEALKADVKATLAEFPNMQTYAEQYIRDMENLSVRIGNNQHKKRYIIVPYDEAGILEQLSDGEKEAYAAKEILNRCNSIRSNLNSVGVLSHKLNNEELIELLYSCYNRENISYAHTIASGDAFGLFVDGEEDKFSTLPKVGLLDLILGESINRIRLNGLDRVGNGQAVLQQLEALRQKYAGYFTDEV